MRTEEFFVLFIEHLPVYLVSFFIVLIPYIFLIKRSKLFILDPLFYSFSMAIFSSSVPFFLFFIKQISFDIFLNFLLTQLAFIFGFLLFKPIDITKERVINIERNKNENSLIPQVIFLVFSGIFVFNQVAIYWLRGIPLFMPSRLDLFTEGNGLGALSRIGSVASAGVLFLSFVLLVEFKVKLSFRILIYVILFFFVVSCILSGSRGQIFGIGFIFFLYVFYSVKYNKSNLKYFKLLRGYSIYLLIVGISVVYIAYSLKYSKVNVVGFASLDVSKRFICTGDIYWNAYPHNLYSRINNSKPILGIFGNSLASLRLISWDDVPPSIGRQLYRMTYPEITAGFGSNARHNLLGLMYFGKTASIFFSFSLGFLLGFLRNYLYRILEASYLGGLVYCLLYPCLTNFESDFPYAMNMLFDFLLTVVVIFGLTLTLYFIIKYFSHINDKGSSLYRWKRST